MSKRSIRKNSHREDKGSHRRTWPTCVRRLRGSAGNDYIFKECTITIGTHTFKADGGTLEIVR